MIIECPACHTRYRTDGSLAITDFTLFECSREQCGHVFSYSLGLSQETGGEPPLGDSPLESPDTPFAESLSVPANNLPPDQQSPLGHVSNEFSTTTPSPKRTSPLKGTGQLPQVTGSFSEDFTEPEDFTLDSPILSSPAPSFSSSAMIEEGQRNEPAKRNTSSRHRLRPAPMKTFSVWPVLGLLVLLVLGYYFLGSRWRMNVTDTESMLSRLPFVGSSFVASQFSPQHIALSEVKSGFWLTKDSKRVFAISGKATNNASVAASLIQIEGQLHDMDGKTIEQRVTSCGMGTTADSLPTLTTREINVLQGLAPPKQFHVPPGHAVNFLIVFPTPPAAVTEVSCRVATAQFGTS